MTTSSLLSRGKPNGTPDAKRVAIGAGAGAAIEVYDFIGFGTAAALYLGPAFFPHSSPLIGTLQAFLTLGVGFVARPFGGIIAGYFGDRIGRKPMLVASLLVMGFMTVIMGLLPTYEQVGALAPILLVFVRVIQGIAFGAEWGGAVLMTYEHAPLDKKGKYTGIMHAGFAVGLLLANLAFLATAPLGNNWSWRIPFLFSAVLIILGLIIRSKLTESPAFEAAVEAGKTAHNPLKDALSNDWRAILLGVAIRVAEPAGYAVAVTFMLSYLKLNGLASNSTVLTAVCVAAAVGIFATPMWGKLTDRVGRKPLFIGAVILGAIMAIPLFLMANTGRPLLIGLVLILAYPVFQNALVAVQGTLLPEMYRPEIRFSGASLAYQLSAVIAGFTPFIASALYLWVGWVGPAVLFMVFCAISGTAVLFVRESWGHNLKAEAKILMDQESRNHEYAEEPTN
ncbi:MFS transporter [Paeniglutamicibacter psychrophenolicus]|uniref:MFS family permease n=1 Tax=Paeniglutamicibacter psychrophenolicus TaxID=257454 RepID=A0ABS4WJU9_9MICC|nr:MFS transporter [Paeniglutamicibacter psychrophenolicus]MBP2376413.1 MFS family permease [Paeniglutamicibacter psychrophenolicus]